MKSQGQTIEFKAMRIHPRRTIMAVKSLMAIYQIFLEILQSGLKLRTETMVQIPQMTYVYTIQTSDF